MALYGYWRCSTNLQDQERQVIALKEEGVPDENIYGDNSHHIIESCFKGLARSLRAALEMDPRNKNTIPSTKGSL